MLIFRVKKFKYQIYLNLIWFIFLIFCIENRHHGLSFFDASEFAYHIAGDGIAHAPGYPLYTLIGKFFFYFTQDAFDAQFYINILSSFLSVNLIYLSFTQKPDDKSKKLGLLAGVFFMSSYLIKLYTVLPEVFLLNCTIFSLIIYGISFLEVDKFKISTSLIGLAIGLGLSHHHLILLGVLPTFLVVMSKFKKKSKNEVILSFFLGVIGLLIGLIPTYFLFWASRAEASYTFFQVTNFDEYFYVLSRKGYGTFRLTNDSSFNNLFNLYVLFLKGFIKNLNIINLLFLFPLIWPLKRREQLMKLKKLGPLFWFSFGTLLMYFLIFLPLANIPLELEFHKNVFLRFVSLPALLVIYVIFIPLREFEIGKKQFIIMLTFLIASNFYAYKDLNFSNADELSRHIEFAYLNIMKNMNNSEKGEIGENYSRCVLVSFADSISFGTRFYNNFYASKKCYVYSLSSFQEGFRSLNEEKLAKLILGNSYDNIFQAYPRSQVLVFETFFQKLFQKGYKVFLMYPTNMFASSNFRYIPIGSILEIQRNDKSENISKEIFEKNYFDYLEYLHKTISEHNLNYSSSLLIDEAAQGTLFFNLEIYHSILPAPKFQKEYNSLHDQILEIKKKRYTYSI